MDLQRLIPSGRTVQGPSADLVELHHGGHVWTALVHHPPFRRPGLVEQVLTDARDYLEDPAVEGVVELDGWDPEGHRLIYPTQRVWSMAELLAGARAAGRPLGLRVGLELAYVGGLVLQEGAEAGEERGAPLHGDVSPWRLVCDEEGSLHLVGWGIPPLELYAADDDSTLVVPGDVFRYCAPERVTGSDEDLSTDLFSLGLVVVEAIVGQPVYSGTRDEIVAQSKAADVERRLFRFADRMPEDVRLFLGRVLDRYRDARHDDIEDYLGEAHDLLYGPLTDDLETLADVVTTFGVNGPRLPRIPEANAPRWRDPAASRSRWERPRRSSVHKRQTHTPDDPEVVTPLASRSSRGGPSSAAAALRAALTESRDGREEALKEQLGRSSTRTPRAPVRDRNGLFPHAAIQGEATRFLVELPSGGTVWTRLSPKETLALSAARIADKACPTPVDPTGMLTGWYRIEQGGSGWFGDTLTSVLSADDPVTLSFVPNRVVTVTLVLEGQEDTPVTMDVGTAVHVQFLLSHFRQRFQLRARDWELWAEEARPLDVWQILDDHDPKDGLELSMRRARSRRRSLRRRS